MKRLLSMLMIVSMLICAISCENKNSTNTGDHTASTEVSSTPQASDADGRINAGNISAICPEGWKSFPVMSYDDDNEIDPNELKFYKGVTDDDLKDTQPSIAISFKNKGPVGADKSFLEGEDIEPLEIGGRIWEGFEFEWAGDSLAKLISSEVGDTIYLTVWLVVRKDQPITLHDTDLQEIIASILVEN